jgi:hypothetical protein
MYFHELIMDFSCGLWTISCFSSSAVITLFYLYHIITDNIGLACLAFFSETPGLKRKEDTSTEIDSSYVQLSFRREDN